MDEATREGRDRLVARLTEALARDHRVGELELEVTLAQDGLTVTGVVPTEERRSAVAEVLAERAPGVAVRNLVEVAGRGEPDAAEELP